MDFDRLPDIGFRWYLVIYQILAVRIGFSFLAEALDGGEAMPEVVYARATEVPAVMWAALFILVHLTITLTILTAQWRLCSMAAFCSSLVYVAIGVTSVGAPGGDVVAEFSIGLHAVMQAVLGYIMLRKWMLGDD